MASSHRIRAGEMVPQRLSARGLPLTPFLSLHIYRTAVWVAVPVNPPDQPSSPTSVGAKLAQVVGVPDRHAVCVTEALEIGPEGFPQSETKR